MLRFVRFMLKKDGSSGKRRYRSSLYSYVGVSVDISACADKTVAETCTALLIPKWRMADAIALH